MIKGIKKIGFFTTIGLFCVLFQPPILSFNVMHIVGLLSIFYLFISRFAIKGFLLAKRLFIYFFFLLLYLFVFVFVVNKESVSNVSFPIFYIIDVIPFSIVVVQKFSKNKNLAYRHFFEVVVLCGLLQAACSIIAFIFPPIQEFFISRLVAYGYSTDFDRFSSYRLFGFSTGLTFIMPVVQTVISIIAIAYATIFRKKRYMIYSFALLFSAFINARVSIIIFAVGFLLFVCFSKVKIFKKISTVFISLALGLAFVYIVLPFIERISPDTYRWFLYGTEEIQRFVSNEIDGGYFAYVLNPERYVLPSSFLGLIFGSGHNIMGGFERYGVYSDVGFINDIWLGGVAYVVVLYGFIFYLLFAIFKKTHNSLVKFVALFLLFCYPILNFKGIIFSMNGLTNLLIIIFSIVVAKSRDKKETIKLYVA